MGDLSRVKSLIESRRDKGEGDTNYKPIVTSGDKLKEVKVFSEPSTDDSFAQFLSDENESKSEYNGLNPKNVESENNKEYSPDNLITNLLNMESESNKSKIYTQYQPTSHNKLDSNLGYRLAFVPEEVLNALNQIIEVDYTTTFGIKDETYAVINITDINKTED